MEDEMGNKVTDAGAKAFLGFARQYYAAANTVLEHSPLLWYPLYFLYFHAAEMLLKAFLRANALPILGTERKSHKLTELYEECRSLGLIVDSADRDRFQVKNIVSLLESGNEYQGFRYWSRGGTSMPELGWTKEVVGQLLQTAESSVEVKLGKDTEPGVATGMVAVYGKPRPRRP
jgi:hypothetical protein